jgi:hypothetical protein
VDTFSERCEVLGEAVMVGIDAAQAGRPAWTRATRLPGWDVAALAAHASLLVRGLGLLSSQPMDAEPAA